MVDYNIVNHCGFCKKRFVVSKAKGRQHYCDACREKFSKAKD